MRIIGHRVALSAVLVVSAVVLTLVLAACGGDDRDPLDDAPPASVGRVATLQPTGDAGPGATVAGSPNPSGSDDPAAAQLQGSFRRGGVPVPVALEAKAAAACRAVPQPPYVEEIGSRPVVVTDMRGLGVILVVFADGNGATGCRVEVAVDGSMRASFFRLQSDPAKALDAGDVTLDAMEYVDDGTKQRAIAVGRVGDRAVNVRAGFDDDTYVTATVRDGWYAMWWPGQTRAAVVVATDNRNEAMGTVSPP